MLTTKPRRKRRTLVKRKGIRTGGKRKPLNKRKRRLLGRNRKKGYQARQKRLRRRKARLSIPAKQAIPDLPPVPEQAVPLQAPSVHDPASYQQAYDEAYQEGFNSGFSKGFEDGHKLAYKNRV